MKRKPVADEGHFDGAGQSDYLLYSHTHSFFSLLEKYYIIYAQCHVPYIKHCIKSLYFHIRYLTVPRKREISTFIQFCKTTGITCQVPYMARYIEFECLR